MIVLRHRGNSRLRSFLPPPPYPSDSPKYESFLKQLRSRIASHPDVAEGLLERIDDALSANAPGIIAARVMITELVTNHCYHSCDNPGDVSTGGRDLAVNHGVREVMETACLAKSLPRRSWAVSSYYAFAAASRTEFEAVETEAQRSSATISGCLNEQRRRLDSWGPLCVRCGGWRPRPNNEAHVVQIGVSFVPWKIDHSHHFPHFFAWASWCFSLLR